MQPQTFENTKSRFSPQTFPRRYLILCKKKKKKTLRFPPATVDVAAAAAVTRGVWWCLAFQHKQTAALKAFLGGKYAFALFWREFCINASTAFKSFFWFVVRIKCNRREVCAINFKGFWMGLHFPLLPCTQNKDLTRGRSRSFCYKEFQFFCFWPCEPLLSQLVFFYSSHAPYA